MEYTEMQMELKQFLLTVKTISDTKCFVEGVLSLVAHEDDLKVMYDWIKKHPDANESQILEKALDLNIPRTEPERVIK
ncbi:hypothetical protein NQ499_06790 [Catenibacterium mitsuokai]|uniref:hypothetical protein n=1 Tax=Catenibacterium mitsuokai TaxID=100886 RepID=UPI00058F39CC|nr:hypothetical protein [Catenibacterium mitsuokai]UWO51988.1 hypothetical protein NQ499_06790 [Catenibacterium mitsuokai]